MDLTIDVGGPVHLIYVQPKQEIMKKQIIMCPKGPKKEKERNFEDASNNLKWSSGFEGGCELGYRE